ncbi:DUF3800 domain-containing protein [Geobacillus thermodenitrificans]|uniref:DUF3800 domain-containing protein n=1 Tax=Geobacillus thermodenitrificans TaxID=33940 RepID=UPI002E241A22|nr:DUF3800 domain-containing protein [Geobacillus thermodenitrificans]
MTNWLIFCEESGDKGIPWTSGSSDFYVITGILVREDDEEAFKNTIEHFKYKELRLKQPLEWKKLTGKIKRDDSKLSRFLRKIDINSPQFLVTNVICNKHETNGPGLVDRNVFMNYLYGLMFKRICRFLYKTKSRAKLIIDRNTDPIAQESLRKYISDISRFYTGEHPRHSKPKWLNPEDHPILGLADFISGVTLRSLTDYYYNVNESCKKCDKLYHIYTCKTSNFGYYRSYKYIHDWNYEVLVNWDWRGLIYHPFEYKDNYKHLFVPR